MTIVVIGATGRIGSEVVRLLSARGESVRALVRDPAQAVKLPNVAWFQGDLEDPNTLHPLMSRADSMFLLVPNAKGMLAFSHNALVVAEEEGVSYVVKLSALGTSPHSTSSIDRWHHEGETELRNSTMSWTILRPHAFMQNFLDLAPSIVRTGKLFSAAGNAQVPFIDSRDVAAVAARVLTEPGYEGVKYVLTGPEPIGYADVARMIGEVAGRPIQFVPETTEQARARLTREGRTADVIEDLLAAAEYQRAGGPAALATPAVQEITGHPPRHFQQFVADHRAAFAPPAAG
jgi:uncharacterized protein YbjT (DUF2867 family)